MRDPASPGPGERAVSTSIEGASGAWFPATPAPTSVALAPRGSAKIALGVLVVAAVALAVSLAFLETPARVPVAVVAVGLALVARDRLRRGGRSAATSVARRGLAIDGDALVLVPREGERRAVLSMREPFGVTLVTTRARDRLVVAVSSAAGVFYIGADFDPSERVRFASLLGRASAVATDETGLEALGSDGEPLDLAPSALASLVEALVERDPGCLERVLLSDARGAAVSVDAHAMHVGDASFELGSPLEWRAFVFQEALGHAVAIYQATWVKQGSAEVVLVALLPSLAPAREMSVTGIPELDRAGVRDLRLGQATPDEPPPAERRVAIDRLFMLPMRVALDRAPRASQRPTHASA